MNRTLAHWHRRRNGGQTLVIALIILGLLLLLGFVFLGIINRNIKSAATQQNRTMSNDYAEAGIRYAHQQLLQSTLGADWRPRPTSFVRLGAGNNFTNDPDALYLRPGTGLAWPGNPNQRDMGGPDGLGPFSRVGFNAGRSLVRVRFGPTDANPFAASPSAAMRNPGASRNYTIIESVGREGLVNTSDPTLAPTGASVQIGGITTTAQLESAIRGMREVDAQMVTSRRLRAFASIGIIESGRYITNKNKVSRPIDIGIPSDLGASIGGFNVAADLPQLYGGLMSFVNPANGTTTPPLAMGGGIWANGQLRINGRLQANINRTLDGPIVATDSFTPATGDSAIDFNISSLGANGIWSQSTQSLTGAALDSRNAGFTTSGLLVDGKSAPGRGVGEKAPPSLEAKDRVTGELRYRQLTRDSGTDFGAGTTVANTGYYGHGRGVYVDNVSDRQQGSDENARGETVADESLEYDWLNPNNGQAESGWQGPFYIPRGAYLELRSDGFVITRDGRAPAEDRFWRNPDGTLSSQTSLRYRLGYGTISPTQPPVLMVVNSLTPGVDIDSDTPDFSLGQPFNGVLFFEGNVRVRGVIPTDVQLSVVSNATIYIEGSITKGIVGNDVTSRYNDFNSYFRDKFGQDYPLQQATRTERLQHSSRSTLMLGAKDYVALNTSMFFGPTSGTQVESIPSSPTQNYSAVRMQAAGGQLSFLAEMAMEPNGANPRNWRPYAANYTEFNTNTAIPTRLLLTHAMDDGPAGASFLGLNVNQDAQPMTSAYNFPRIFENWAVATNPQPPLSVLYTNTMANYNVVNNPTYYPIYGLGSEAFQRAPNFETVALAVVRPDRADATLLQNQAIVESDVTPGYNDTLYSIYTQGSTPSSGKYLPATTKTSNQFTFQARTIGNVASNDYQIARASLVPHDIRIEATIFAENGSFFVIPGPWFNANPDDTRSNYEQAVQQTNRQTAEIQRMERFGASPITPFYGEPIDVKVQIVGAVSENLPPQMGKQAEWLRKWGWIPRRLGGLYDYQRNREVSIPDSHVRGTGFENAAANTARQYYVPNLVIAYDPALATARSNGFVNTNDPFNLNSPVLRWDEIGRALPPMPRLPVSPTLAYFGEEK